MSVRIGVRCPSGGTADASDLKSAFGQFRVSANFLTKSRNSLWNKVLKANSHFCTKRQGNASKGRRIANFLPIGNPLFAPLRDDFDDDKWNHVGGMIAAYNANGDAETVLWWLW